MAYSPSSPNRCSSVSCAFPLVSRVETSNSLWLLQPAALSGYLSRLKGGSVAAESAASASSLLLSGRHLTSSSLILNPEKLEYWTEVAKQDRLKVGTKPGLQVLLVVARFRVQFTK